MRTATIRAAAFAFMCVAQTAFADDPSHDQAVAAFDEARKLIDAGDCDGAIPRLEQSIRYEPSIGARLSLADCTEQKDPLVAWNQLHEAERLAFVKHDARTSVAHDRAVGLEKRVAMVAITIPQAALDQSGFQLRIDGITIDTYFFTDPKFAVKPGQHLIEASAPQKRFSQSVVAQIGEATTVTIVLTDETPPVPPPPQPIIVSDHGAGQRTVGIVLGAVGFTSLVVGSAFGIAALAKKSDIDKECGGSASVCTAPPGSVDQMRSEQQTLTHVSTAAVIAGAALLVSGALVFLTAPRSPTAPRVGAVASMDGAALVFTGLW